MQHRIISWAEQRRRKSNTKHKDIVLTEAQISKYLSRVLKGKSADCWLFQSSSKKEYPYHQNYLAHRIAYFIYKGKIPKGLTIDHLCQTKWCQNPNHLEPVTRKENTQRYHANRINT